MTLFFGIKGAFFSKTTRRICDKIFFQDLGETLVHYNLRWKELHPGFSGQ